jgi:purine nucleosidase
VSALIDIFKGRPGQIELLALGPLTNIALAARLEPSFPSRVKHITIMGGCESARGNSSMTAEFNFFADPEAAHIVLDVFTRDKLLPVFLAHKPSSHQHPNLVTTAC